MFLIKNNEPLLKIAETLPAMFVFANFIDRNC